MGCITEFTKDDDPDFGTECTLRVSLGSKMHQLVKARKFTKIVTSPHGNYKKKIPFYGISTIAIQGIGIKDNSKVEIRDSLLEILKQFTVQGQAKQRLYFGLLGGQRRFESGESIKLTGKGRKIRQSGSLGCELLQ